MWIRIQHLKRTWRPVRKFEPTNLWRWSRRRTDSWRGGSPGRGPSPWRRGGRWSVPPPRWRRGAASPATGRSPARRRSHAALVYFLQTYQERSGLRIRIDLMRIRIPHFFSLRIRIQLWIHGFDDQKLKKIKAEKNIRYFIIFDKKI